MTDSESFDAWITKYALTIGIQRSRVKLCAGMGGEMIEVIGGRNEYYHRNDWHRDESSARDRAEQMKQGKLASIDKQRKRIAALSFK